MSSLFLLALLAATAASVSGMPVAEHGAAEDKSRILCRRNEIWYECGSCDASCKNLNPACPAICRPGCGCIEGHVRDLSEENRCIPKGECPIIEPGETHEKNQVKDELEPPQPAELKPDKYRPPKPIPIAINPPMCPENEKFFPCGACDGSCSNTQPGCTRHCKEHGSCGCIEGHVRESEGSRCIHQSKCLRVEPEIVHPPMEEVRPPMVQVNPPMEEVRPPMKEVRPPMEEVRQPMKGVHPPMEEVHPPMEEVRPPMVQVNPPMEEVRPPMKEVRPPMEEVRQPMKGVHPPMEEVHPPMENMRPPMEEVHPPMENMRSPMEEVRPPMVQVNPPLEEVRPPPANFRPPFEEVVPRCPEKEVWMPCGACDGSCSQIRGVCTKQCRSGGCGCMKDHVREPKGHGCIHVSHCADLSPVFPPQID